MTKTTLRHKATTLIKGVLLMTGIIGAEALAAGALEDKVAPTRPTLTKVEDLKTAKGIRVWFVKSTEIPVLSVTFAFKNAGNKNDPKTLSGLCRLLASVLDEGAGEYDSQGFKRRLLEKNIELSIHQDRDNFSMSFRTVKENIPEAFRLLKLMLTQAKLDQDSLARVKNQIKVNIEQSLQNPRSFAAEKFDTLLYGDHPYSRTSKSVLAEVDKVTAEDLRTFMKERFALDQLVVSAVGDISSEDLLKLLDETFAGQPEKAKPTEITEVKFQNLNTVKVFEMDIPQSSIVFAQPGLYRKDPDFLAVLLLTEIFGASEFESRLWNEVREKRGLAYGIGFGPSWSDHAALLKGGTATKNESTKEVVDIIRQELKKIIDSGVTERELAFVKQRLEGSFALNFSSTPKFAAALLKYQLDDLPPTYINDRNALLEKVTLADVNRVAKERFKPEEFLFVIIGKPGNLTAPDTQKDSDPQPQ